MLYITTYNSILQWKCVERKTQTDFLLLLFKLLSFQLIVAISRWLCVLCCCCTTRFVCSMETVGNVFTSSREPFHSRQYIQWSFYCMNNSKKPNHARTLNWITATVHVSVCICVWAMICLRMHFEYCITFHDRYNSIDSECFSIFLSLPLSICLSLSRFLSLYFCVCTVFFGFECIWWWGRSFNLHSLPKATFQLMCIDNSYTKNVYI